MYNVDKRLTLSLNYDEAKELGLSLSAFNTLFEKVSPETKEILDPLVGKALEFVARVDAEKNNPALKHINALKRRHDDRCEMLDSESPYWDADVAAVVALRKEITKLEKINDPAYS
jgi:hypothetical protein